MEEVFLSIIKINICQSTLALLDDEIERAKNGDENLLSGISFPSQDISMNVMMYLTHKIIKKNYDK